MCVCAVFGFNTTTMLLVWYYIFTQITQLFNQKLILFWVAIVKVCSNCSTRLPEVQTSCKRCKPSCIITIPHINIQ